MALLWIDGFEGYTTANGTAVVVPMGRRYASIVGYGSSPISFTGRFGGLAIKTIDGNEQIWTPSLTTNDTLVVGAAVYMPTTHIMNGYDRHIFDFYDGSTQGINLILRDDYLKVYRGATLLATSSAPMGVVGGIWYYYEMKVKCNSTVGTYEVQFNGTTVIGLVGTGANTKGGTNNYHDVVKLQASAWTIPCWDDFYICDGSGSINNTLLGPQQVKAIWLKANGDTNDWSVGAGSGLHYTLTDENPPDDNTTYVYSRVSGARELYQLDPSPITDNISGVQVNFTIRVDDIENKSYAASVRSGGNTVDSVLPSLTSPNYSDTHYIQETDPLTGNSWTKAGLDSVQLGLKIV